AVPWVREAAGLGARLVALGDDVTDEDMFRVLGAGDEGIRVGSPAGAGTSAHWQLQNAQYCLGFLKWIASVRREGPTLAPPLWPLFHSFPGNVRFSRDEWECYEKVNDSFAAAAVDLVGPDTPIWAHDYHLLLLASALRKRGHRGPVGHFLHIPFPGVDMFSLF